MYNITVQAQQHLSVTLAVVSISETTDDGRTVQLATAVTTSKHLHASDQDELHIVCEQTIDCVVKALSSQGGRVWTTENLSAALDGGWGGGRETGTA